MKPMQSGGEPRYAEKKLGQGAVSNELKLLFSGSGREESTEIRQMPNSFSDNSTKVVVYNYIPRLVFHIFGFR